MARIEQQTVNKQKDDERESFGPAMLACRPDEREFVALLLQGKSAAEAAKLAGWGETDSSSQTLARIAYRLTHRPRVQEALAEEIKKLQRGRLPIKAIQAVEQILDSQFHKDRARTALAILERIDPTVSRQEIEVTHKFDPVKTTLNFLASLKARGWTREQLLGEFSPFELDHYEKLLAVEDHRIVDADFVEVDPDTDILGD